MRAGAVPVGALLLIIATTVLQVQSAEDVYLDLDDSKEFLEIDDDSSLKQNHRFKRQFSWLFSTPTTTEVPEVTADPSYDDLPDDKDSEILTEGSGYPESPDREIDTKEKTLRVTFVVMESYHDEYMSRDSVRFQNFSKSLADAVNLLYETLPGRQSASLVRIQSLPSDEFTCKVTLDIVTTGYDDTDMIARILENHIKTRSTLGNITVLGADFSAKIIDPETTPGCARDEIQCGDFLCVPGSVRCNNFNDCSDGADELGCETVDLFEQTNQLPFQSSEDTTPSRRGDDDDLETTTSIYNNNNNGCSGDEFLCDLDRCLQKISICDGRNDCFDGTDEQNCPSETCGRDDFRCYNGQCIKPSSRCDKIVDCANKEDELNCECTENEFRCADDGSCIEGRKQCDGNNNCADGSDERDCPACGSDQWQCDYGNCIKRYMRCNGRVDCPTDRSDERNCIASNGYFRCSSGDYIPEYLRCNREYDCPRGDYSDEQNCPCGENDFKCDNGFCIPSSKHCDRTHDCQDGSDERECTYGTVCMAYQYKCSSGQCVPSESWCNGTTECADKSDESNCPCKRGEHQCREGSCINAGLLCDGKKDCPIYGEDETNCAEPAPAGCLPEEFVCPTGGRCAKQCNNVPECEGAEDEEGCNEDCNHECDGKCLNDIQICDGVPDCVDESDERDCLTCDGADDFRCQNGECLNRLQRCNELEDCADGSDEQNCTVTATAVPQTCAEGQYQCRDGQCINSHFYCDGNPDCVDNSDEEYCTWFGKRRSRSSSPAPCREAEFTCDDGRCIPHQRRCDNIYDCSDFSDEQNCFYSGTDCLPGYFQCGTIYQCIPPENYCDGRPDCRDNSDEENCPTDITTTHLPPPEPTRPPYRPPPVFVPEPPTSTETERNEPDGCSRNEWRCENGPCIDRSLRCNGRFDCPYDSSDELDCAASRYPSHALNLKTYPNRQNVRDAFVGGDVVFFCRDEGSARAKVQWKRQDGRPFPPDTIQIRGRLELYKVTLRDNGAYVCQAIDYFGQPNSETIVELTVLEEQTFRPPFACLPNEHTCGNRQCISSSAVCDGKYDCTDKSDEDSCRSPGKCEPNAFQCNNKKCIFKTWMCDSEDDCGDNSDEENCEKSSGDYCLPVEFKCNSGNQCIPKSFHCDGQSDCLDGSDENCIPIHVTSPPQPANIKLNPGDTLVLRCTAVGVPTPLISWRLNWGHVPEQCTSTSENGEGVLTCPNMQAEHSGAYSCEAMNNKATSFATPDAIVFVNRTNDVCPPGYFNSEARNAGECIRCFCFGESTQCKSADLFTYNMPTPLGQGGTKLIGAVRNQYSGDIKYSQSITENYDFQPLRNGAIVSKMDNYGQPESELHAYLSLPETYQGNQLTSYGGHISYKMSPHFPSYVTDSYQPEIIIKGKYVTLTFKLPADSPISEIDARLTPGGWQKDGPDGTQRATREDIMMALDHVEMILLRADNNGAGVNITDFNMESAQTFNTGLGSASLVEECRCPPGYEGLSCQKCGAGYVRENSGPWLGNCVPERPECPQGTYGDPASNYACRPCPCPLTNRENQFARTCSLGPRGVVCDCDTGYEGENCEQCAEGYEGNPMVRGDSCQPRRVSNCSPAGTARALGDFCECKENARGQYCDQCKEGSFYLSENNSQGCALCFCSGVSQRCTSSNLRRKSTTVRFNVPQIVDQVKVYNSAPPGGSVGATRYLAPVATDAQLRIADGEIFFRPESYNSEPAVYYWSLPITFAGDKVTSYGGRLSFIVKYFSAPGASSNNAADIQLVSDNHLTFHYFGGFEPGSDGYLNASAVLTEKGWQRSDGKEVTREHFLLALADVSTFLVKASYSSNTQMASLVSASIETADANGYGPPAVEVEQCMCPPEHVGTSCEDCAPGYTRSTNGFYLEHCELCSCNGRSTMCHPETGVCSDCSGNTAGDKCELCQDGYEFDSDGNCVPSGDYTTRPACDCDERGISRPCYAGVCECKENVEGSRCDRCRAASFDLTAADPRGCASCYCSGVTTDCHLASNYYRMPIPAPIIGDDFGGFRLTSLNDDVPVSEQYVPVSNESEITYIFSETARRGPGVDLFWSIPALTGHRVLSYNGYLQYTLVFDTVYPEEVQPDRNVIFVGDDISVYWNNPDVLTSLKPTVNRVGIREGEWFILDTGALATRRDLMSVLANLNRVLVRATLSENIVSTSIADVSIDTAISTSVPGAQPATGIEVCVCPEGYTGTSCESCKPGYYADAQGYCRQCNCNGFSCELNSYDEVTCICPQPYIGPDCSRTDNELPDTTTYSPPIPSPPIEIRISGPVLQITDIGSSVNFTCEAQSQNSQGRLPITWSKRDGFLPQGRSIVDYNYGTLIITNVQISDSGVYLCQSSDGVATAVVEATLKVPGNPMTAPTAEIRDAIKEYNEGDVVTLECLVTGNPAPSITWQRSGNFPLSLYHSSYNQILTIENARREDSGEYRCVASNRIGAAEATGVLNIRPRNEPALDSLSISPTAPNVDEGQSMTIVCTGSVNVPPGAIGWIRQDGTELLSNVHSDNGVLYIDVAQLANQGVYICQASSSSAEPVPVLITVRQLNTQPLVEPSVTLQESSITIPTGGTHVMDCVPQGNPLPVVKWKKYGGDFGRSTTQRDNSLIIAEAQDNDKGYYVCNGLLNGIEVAQAYVYVNIEIREVPEVSIWPEETEHTVTLESQYEFLCQVTGGNPEPVVTWHRSDDRPLSRFTQILPGNVLKFEKIDVNDEGEYVCTAVNSAGSKTASAFLKVRAQPEITLSQSYVQAVYGEPITVDCRASGYPQPKVTISSNADSRDLVGPNDGIASLRISSSTEQNSGDYTCTATNDAGIVTEQFAIRVTRGDGGDDVGPDNGETGGNPTGEPELPPDSPIPKIGFEGKDATLSCDSNDGSEVAWQRVDASLTWNTATIGNKLIIKNATKDDSGIYECSLYNHYTGTQRAMQISLKVVALPVIRLIPQQQTVYPGQSPTVECLVEGDDIRDITWKSIDRPLSSRAEINGAVLTFHNIEIEDAGRYDCVATTKYANVTGTAEVIVNEFVDHGSRANTRAHPGSKVMLSCNVTSPDFRIRWNKNGGPVPRNARMKADGTLVINNVRKTDSGRYECVVRDRRGRKTSNFIQLIILGYECTESQFACSDGSDCIHKMYLCDGLNDCSDGSDERNCIIENRSTRTPMKKKYYDRETPAERLVAIEKPLGAFTLGQDVSVTCKAPSQDVSVDWQRVDTNQIVDTRVFAGGLVLVITNVHESDSGVYRCVGRDAYGRTTYDDFNLQVLPAQPERPEALTEHNARLRDSVVMPCTHNLEGPVSFKWTRESIPLPAELKTDESFLELQSVSASDAGVYECRAWNGRGGAVSHARLRVLGVVPRFDGHAWLSLPSLRDAYRQFSIEVSFKPADFNGLIFYNSEKQGRSGDFISLQLIDSRPQFIHKTAGSSVETIYLYGDRPLQLNTWHTIRISKIDFKASMSVDNTGPFVNQTQDQWELLDLGQPMYIGGVPNIEQLPDELAGAAGFIGCISLLVMGNKEVNLMIDSLEKYNVLDCDNCAPNLCLNNGVCQDAANERGYVCLCPPEFPGRNCNRTGEACRPGLCGEGKCIEAADGYKCSCPITATGKNCELQQYIEYPAFTGSAFLALMKSRGKHRVLRMSLKIRPSSPVTDGIVMYCAESARGHGGFTALTVREGHVEFRYDVGDGQPAIVTSRRQLQANEWTEVNIARIGGSVNLKIGSVEDLSSKLISHDRYMYLDTPMFIGGVDESIVLNNNTGVVGGFYGCIMNITFYGTPVNLVNSSIISSNVQECSNYDRGDIPEVENVCKLCRNGGYCSREDGECVCRPGFTGQYCETQLPQDPCRDSPCRNGGSCRPDRAARLNYTCDCPLGFGGAYCHKPVDLYQSVGFTGNGYLELPSRLVWFDRLDESPAVVALAVNTRDDGVLFYQGETNTASDYGDFWLLRVENGLVVLDWNLGNGESSITVTDLYVNDDTRHLVIAKLYLDGTMSLTVDQFTKNGTSGVNGDEMNANSNLYIGGMPDVYNVNNYPWLSGCFEQVETMYSDRGLNLGKEAVAGRNTQQCADLPGR